MPSGGGVYFPPKWMGGSKFGEYKKNLVYYNMDKHIEFEKKLEKAYYSTYRIITNKVSFTDLLDEDTNKGNVTLLVHDPDKEISENTIKDVIEYYEGLEEYERCAELLEALNKKINT